LVLAAILVSRGAIAQGLFTLGGKSYSEKDLSPAQQQQFFELRNQAYEQEKAFVDHAVLEMHLDEESKKQQKSRDEIEKKLFDVKEPSERQMKAWFEENKSRIPPNYQFDQIKGEIAKIVKQEEMKKKRESVVESRDRVRQRLGRSALRDQVVGQRGNVADDALQGSHGTRLPDRLRDVAHRHALQPEQVALRDHA
jgi:hypothetical protein